MASRKADAVIWPRDMMEEKGVNVIESRDILAVQRNWHIASNDLTALGIDVFTELFQLHNSYIDLFHGIRAWGEATGANPKLREHALRVISAFGSWIASLHDRQVLLGLLAVQSKDHRARSIGPQHFATMKRAMFRGLEKRLGNMFNRRSWDKVYSFLEECLLQGKVEDNITRLN